MILINADLVHYSSRFPTPTGFIVLKHCICIFESGKDSIYHSLRKINLKKGKKEASYPMEHAFIADTIRHTIVEVTSTCNAYIHYFLSTIKQHEADVNTMMVVTKDNSRTVRKQKSHTHTHTHTHAHTRKHTYTHIVINNNKS